MGGSIRAAAAPAARAINVMDPRVFGALCLVLSPLALAFVARSGALSRRAFDSAPPRPGSLGPADLFVTAGLFLVLPALLVQVMFREAGLDLSDVEAVTKNLLAMLCGQAGMALVALYVLSRAGTAVAGGLRGWGLREPGRSLPRAAGAFVAVFPLVTLTAAVMNLVVLMLGRDPPVIAHGVLQTLVEAPRTPAWWGLIGTAVLLAPLLEELIFRGMVQTALLQCGIAPTRWGAIAWTSLLFVLIHTSIAEPHALPSLYVLSIGLGWAYERWGSLWTPIFMHAMFNTLQIALAMSLPPDAAGPPGV